VGDLREYPVCTSKLAFFVSFLSFIVSSASAQVSPRVRFWTSESSKRVIPCKDVPFRSLNDVRLNFGRQTKNPEILGE